MDKSKIPRFFLAHPVVRIFWLTYLHITNDVAVFSKVILVFWQFGYNWLLVFASSANRLDSYVWML